MRVGGWERVRIYKFQSFECQMAHNSTVALSTAFSLSPVQLMPTAFLYLFLVPATTHGGGAVLSGRALGNAAGTITARAGRTRRARLAGGRTAPRREKVCRAVDAGVLTCARVFVVTTAVEALGCAARGNVGSRGAGGEDGGARACVAGRALVALGPRGLGVPRGK